MTAVMVEPTSSGDCRDDSQANDHRRAAPDEECECLCHREHLLPSEAEVLERFGRLAVQHRRATLVTAARSEVALGDPRSGAV
jgi:hypothetical protein